MTSVAASGASILSTVVKTVLTRILALGSYVRSMLNFASAELKGSPLCHLTPWRTLNTHVVWPWSFHSVARPGASFPSGRRLVRLSKRLNETRISFDDVLMCGSNWATSPPCATTSSRFCVPCECAGLGIPPGSAAAAPAAAILSTSRRVIAAIHASLGGAWVSDVRGFYMGAVRDPCQGPRPRAGLSWWREGGGAS